MQIRLPREIGGKDEEEKKIICDFAGIVRDIYDDAACGSRRERRMLRTEPPRTMQPTRTTMLDLTSTTGKYMATDGTEKTVDFTNASVIDSAEGWSWNHETKTLTLAGARIVVTEPTSRYQSRYGASETDTITECSFREMLPLF